MKQIIRLTESDLHKIIKESVHKILNEGLTPVFGKIAKQHGGVKWVNKKYQFDKLEFPNYGWDNFFTGGTRSSGIPGPLYNFAERVMDFKDGVSLYVVKPEYHNNQKIKDMLKSSEELVANRSAGYAPGTERRETEVDYGGGPFTKSYTATLSPEEMRQRAHKKARGKSPAEQPRKNNDFRDQHGISQTGDYDEYVKNFLCDKFNGFYVDYHIAVPTPEDGRWGEEASKIIDEFEKYGYGWDESFGNSDIDYAYDWADERTKDRFNPDVDYMGFEKGKATSYTEWDDPGAFGYSASNPYGTYGSHKMPETPKIGTTDFMKQNK